MLTVKTLVVGDLSTNCYLVSSSKAGRGPTSLERSDLSTPCLIIDPGDEADFITETITNEKLTPTAIVLTHGHFDHVLGCLELKLNFDLPILIHKNDLKLYSSANQSALHWLKRKTLKVPPIDQYIKEGDKIKVGTETLTVLETPGHTPGSICLYSSPPLNTKYSILNTILFTGDTLFADGVGRTDFFYSSSTDLANSLEKIKSILSEPFPLSKGESKGVIIYPGHGNSFIQSQ